MARAKEMLRITSMSVKEIAAEIGIEDPSYFSRLYKRITGEYPLHYRNMAIIIEENDRKLVR
jgi:YesN/AraC family two-component response regulator